MSEDVSQKGEKSGKPEIDLSMCPVPPKHVQRYHDCCDAFERGEMSDLQVMETVLQDLKSIKKGRELSSSE